MDDQAGARSGFALLSGSADFRRWYVARTVSVVGVEATAVAVPVLVYRETGSALLTSAVAALEVIPYLVFGLFAGVVADRARRKPLMVGAQAVAGTAVATVPLAWLAGVLTVTHVLAVVFVVATAFVWFDAAAWGALTRVAGRARLTEANSLIWSTTIAASVAIPALVGVAVGVVHPAAVLTVQVVTFAWSAATIGRIATRLDPDPLRSANGEDDEGGGDDGSEAEATRPRGLGSDMLDGLRFVWRTTEIRVLTLASIGLTTSSGVVLGLIVVFATEELGADRHGWRIGLLFAATAVGAFAAAALLPRLSRRVGPGRLSAVALTVCAPLLLAFTVIGSFWPATALLAAWSVANSTAVTNGIVVRQQLAPDDLQGRVNTTARMIAIAGTPVGALLGGVLAEPLGITAAYALACAPVAVAAIGVWASSVPSFRGPADA